MSYLRRISTRRLLAAGRRLRAGGRRGAAAIALAAGGRRADPAAQAARRRRPRRARRARRSTGITARITFTNHLIDAASLAGRRPAPDRRDGPAVGRRGDKLRLELQLRRDGGAATSGRCSTADRLTVYDAGANTVYRGDAPAATARRRNGQAETPPTLARDPAGARRARRATRRCPARSPATSPASPPTRVRISPQARRRAARRRRAGVGRRARRAAARRRLRQRRQPPGARARARPTSRYGTVAAGDLRRPAARRTPRSSTSARRRRARPAAHEDQQPVTGVDGRAGQVPFTLVGARHARRPAAPRGAPRRLRAAPGARS